MSAGAPDAALHAGCVVLGEAGILIRGPSGAGKSTLALRLVQREREAGRFAAHVADDRVLVGVRGGRLVARPHPALAGRLEIRGCGIVTVPFLPSACLRLVVDLVAEAPERLPDEAAARTDLLGVGLPRLVAQPGVAAALVSRRLRGGDDTHVTE